MHLHSWLTFFVATFLICGAPGPNMLHMMASGARHGFRKTFFSMAGCFLAVLLLIGASVAGIAAVLSASPAMFNVLRYAGAAYLVYLGVQAWRMPAANSEGTHLQPGSGNASSAVIFRNGFLVGISNPKALFFAGAFFPQFINPDAPELPQLAILLATFTAMEIGWYAAYALGGHRLAQKMNRMEVRRAFNRTTGALFALFGLALVAKSV